MSYYPEQDSHIRDKVTVVRDIAKLVNVLTISNSLNTKVDYLDVGKSTKVPIDLKKISGVVKNGVVKKTKFIEKKNKNNEKK